MIERPEKVPLVGQLLDGRYKLVREIASGGMSIVYEALHVKIGRVVAIKILHRDLAGDPEVVARFLNEARAVGTFGHPHIVASTDFGELPGHVPYLVLEYLEGHTLADEVREHGPLSVSRTTRIAIQIASALEAAHARDVVHRDLTAANIFLVKKEGNPDHVKVLDFGISKFMSVTDKGPRTRRGLTMGTPEYMAPEQISQPDLIDARVDVYALGVIMYLVLRGELPFTRTPLQSLLTQIVVEPPPPLDHPRIPQALRDIVQKALAKSPEDRFPTMREMGAELQRLSAGLVSDTDFDRAIDALNWPTGATPWPLPVTPSSGPLPGKTPPPVSTSGPHSARPGSPTGPTSAPAIPKTDPVLRVRVGRGVLYASLILALVAVAGVGVLAWRSQHPVARSEAPVAPVAVAPAPAPSAPPTALEPKQVQFWVSSPTPGARVTVRGRTHLLPFVQDLKAGPEPEVVEITAPGREGKRFWITLDHPIALALDLHEGHGVVEATEEETVIASGGTPVDGEPRKGEPSAHGPSSDKSASGGQHHAGGHKHSIGGPVVAQKNGAGSTPSERPPEPKVVPPVSPAEPKTAPPPSPAKVDVPAKAALATTPPAPTTATPKVSATTPAAGTATTPARPAATGLDPAKTQALVRSHLPEIQRCYERGKMDDPEIKGRITVRISVSTSGAVTSAVIETSSLRSSAVESCVVAAIRGWTFPAPVGGPAVISYPFNLR